MGDLVVGQMIGDQRLAVRCEGQIAAQAAEAEGAQRPNAVRRARAEMEGGGIAQHLAPGEADDFARALDAVAIDFLVGGRAIGRVGKLPPRVEGQAQPVRISDEFIAEAVGHHRKVERAVLAFVEHVQVHFAAVALVRTCEYGQIGIFKNGAVAFLTAGQIFEAANAVVHSEAIGLLRAAQAKDRDRRAAAIFVPRLQPAAKSVQRNHGAEIAVVAPIDGNAVDAQRIRLRPHPNLGEESSVSEFAIRTAHQQITVRRLKKPDFTHSRFPP